MSAAPASVPFGDFSRELLETQHELTAAFQEVLTKGRYVLGAQVERFEAEFAAWTGSRFGVGVASGTDAIGLALQALGVGPGDEVITVANTCFPTAAGILRSGATLRLVDCDPSTLQMRIEQLERAVSARTKAVVPVHLYGNAVNMPVLRQWADRRGLVIVEDCAQAAGTKLADRQVGTFGHAAAFSFYPTKNLGALGDGGCVVTPDQHVAERVRMLRNYGYGERDRSEQLGFNSRLDELQAAFLRVKLRHLDGWVERRRVLAARYAQKLAAFTALMPATAPGVLHSYHLFPVLLPQREQVRAGLTGLGVQTLIHYPIPVHLQPSLASLGYKRGDFPAAEQACAQVLSLPIFPQLTDNEVDAAADRLGTLLS